MEKVSYFCPGSLSFIFKVIPDKKLSKMGSVGIGCTVDKGVIVTVKKAKKTAIYFNENPCKFPTVKSVIKSLTCTPMAVDIKSSLPLGFGFGISGASSLATSFAINRLLNLKKSSLELAQIAHIAEIENHTGLGSVGTQITGGFIIKSSAGMPFTFRRLPFEEKNIYAILIGKLETPAILLNVEWLKKINIAAGKTIRKFNILKKRSLENILDLSFSFVRESLLLKNKEVISEIKKIKKIGGHATMSILGNVVLSNVKPNNATGYPIIKLKVTNHNVRLL